MAKTIYRMRGRGPTLPDRVGLSPSTLYDYIRRGLFPQGVRLSNRAKGPVGWPSDIVDAWEATLRSPDAVCDDECVGRVLR